MSWQLTADADLNRLLLWSRLTILDSRICRRSTNFVGGAERPLADSVKASICDSFLTELFLCSRNHLVRFEPEFPLQFLQRRGSPECLHADYLTEGSDISLPPES